MMEMLKKLSSPGSNLAIFLIGILGFMVYPFIPERLESYSVIAFLICSIYLFVYKRGKDKILFNFFIKAALIYVVLIFSVFFSDDVKYGIKKLETMSSLLIMPFIFYIVFPKINIPLKKMRIIFLKGYYICNCIFALSCLFIFCIYENKTYPLRDSNFYRAAIRTNDFFGEHPIYISIFLAIAVLIGFSFFPFKKKINNYFFIISQILISLVLYLLMSKSIIFGLFFSIAAFFILKYKSKLRVFYVILSVLGFILLTVSLPKENNRFLEIFDSKSYASLDMNNSTSVRYNVFKCSILKLSEKPIFGYGAGDVKKELDDCYRERTLGLEKRNLNSHNQYFFQMLSSGIIGLFSLLLLLFHYINISLSYKDYLFFSIIVLYIIAFGFENVLCRQSGVIFFSFLLNFLTLTNYQKLE